jgi:queuosine precursor transporter|tara:strand:- start:431 stop:922 length:492 start_codon:yes stop_codon:yes gene_type:complete
MGAIKFTLAYVISIVLINIGFEHVPLLPLFDTGEKYPPMALIVGLVFVLRDYAQREIGHKILGAMAIGGVLSYFMASPFVALASVVAFLSSELIDWAYYTWSKKSLRDRILISSALSTPIDSVVFLLIINHFSLVATIAMVASKMIAAVVIWYCLGTKVTSKL